MHNKKIARSTKKSAVDHYDLFLKSREAMGVSPKTLLYYRDRLGRFVKQCDYLEAGREDIEEHLKSIPPNDNGLATRHASYRVIKIFYKWLNAEYEIPYPMKNIKAPIVGKPILPSFSREEVRYLIEQAKTVRDKSIIALLTESGLRISELANIKPEDVNWNRRIIKVWGKGRKQAYAPFGRLTNRYLRQSMKAYPPDGNIWGMNYDGIRTVLRRLRETTGLPCNPHTFRRTFACLLRRAGVDSLMIKDLGRWESVEMVERYTRSMNFEDSLKAYRYDLI